MRDFSTFVRDFSTFMRDFAQFVRDFTTFVRDFPHSCATSHHSCAPSRHSRATSRMRARLLAFRRDFSPLSGIFPPLVRASSHNRGHTQTFADYCCATEPLPTHVA